MIVRATDRDTLLRDACRLAVEHGGFRVAWCGLLDEETNTLRRTAFAGDANELAPTVSFTFDEETAKDSAVVEALRTQRPQVCNDLTDQNAKSKYRQEFVARGYRSFVGLPLVVGGHALGCFVLFTDSPDYSTTKKCAC